MRFTPRFRFIKMYLFTCGGLWKCSNEAISKPVLEAVIAHQGGILSKVFMSLMTTFIRQLLGEKLEQGC